MASLVSVIVKAHPDAVGAPTADFNQPASAAAAGLPRFICLPWPAHPPLDGFLQGNAVGSGGRAIGWGK